MVSALTPKSVSLFEEIRNNSPMDTSYYGDLDSLEALYNAGWIDGISDGDDCLWVVTKSGAKLYDLLEDLIV